MFSPGLISLSIYPRKRSAGKGKRAPKIYNTAKQKLLEGKQLVGVTIFSPDPNIYCAAANSGYDFTWIEMQHSPLTYGDVAKMIYACRGASAMPFIRVPDATESDIQKATDIGALGIIVPTVDTVEKAEARSNGPDIHRKGAAARATANTARCGETITGRRRMTTWWWW